MSFTVFFFNDTATTEIYTLSLHDALPISGVRRVTLVTGDDSVELRLLAPPPTCGALPGDAGGDADRKSTRLNSSHLVISYAVFCLKKKKTNINYRLRFGAASCETDDQK